MIGIHYGFSNQLNYNLGTFIKSIIKELNKYKNITKNNENNMSNNDTINKPNIISLENNSIVPTKSWIILIQIIINCWILIIIRQIKIIIIYIKIIKIIIC